VVKDGNSFDIGPRWLHFYCPREGCIFRKVGCLALCGPNQTHANAFILPGKRILPGRMRCPMNSFKTAAAAAIIVTVGSLTAALAEGASSAADRAFVAMVSQGGMFEVKLGEVGAYKGGTEDIKDQGATEMHDHQLVGDKLKSVAQQAGISFPATLNAHFTKELDVLKDMSGPAFDKAYLRDMEDIHAKDGAAFLKESESGTDPRLKAFAAETHRIVLRHIGEIKAIGAGG
jgi:putative membrane protein